MWYGLDQSMLYILPPLLLFHGVAAATLSTSAFLTIFPVLAVGFGTDTFEALSISVLVDCINGAFLGLRYGRKHLRDRCIAVSYSLVGAVLTSITGYFAGIPLISKYDEYWKHGAGYLDFVFAFGFLVRAVKVHRRLKAEKETSVMVGASSNNLIRTPGHDIDTDTGMETDTDDIESRKDDLSQAPSRNGRPILRSFEQPRKVTPSRSRLFKENHVNEQPELPSCCSWRWCFANISGLLISGVCGVIGFGSGNIVAILWMNLFKWDIIPATAVGSIFSMFVMLALFTTYAASGIVQMENIGGIVLVCLPIDILSLTCASHYAQRLHEDVLSAVIGFIFLAIGIGVTVVAFAFAGEL